ncbi:HD domain-containing protein [Puniceicoccales bacterium CK1056]|uniref:HD domain-containing protein n=1 Tax=Oceanipulchritudo coccoides TaxID=2706888 RepID=A0A6B2M1L8_9BACT|nr:HD domain-containing protein [Oceanipulchritudo coccoides]NDV62276.1 HD domain-containing protein [Oceanipulchritudo coccoides]
MNTVAELKELPKDQKVPYEAVVVLRKSSIRKARNDSEFLMVEFGDKSGVFHYICFGNSSHYQLFLNAVEGTIYRVQGSTDYYQNRFSPSITHIEKVHESEVQRYLDRLVECAPIPVKELWTELQGFIAKINHAPLKETVNSALSELEKEFKTIPGAISMHHAYRSGLMEHTVRMCRACVSLLPLYDEVDPDLALAGVILHDLGKALEYTGDLATTKSRLGHLHGHVVLGYRQTRRAAIKAGLSEDLLDRLEHIILSHQGELEWGAAVKAATPEAVFVSMVDNLDAKMGMVQYALRSTPENQDFSDYVAGLGAPLLVRKPQYPA